jgi:hypothetical protein
MILLEWQNLKIKMFVFDFLNQIFLVAEVMFSPSGLIT